MLEALTYLTSVEELRPPYLAPSALMRAKQLDRLDRHCTKALKRSRLWQDDYRLDRAKLPSLGQMISDQTMRANLTVKDIEARIEADAQKNLY